MLGCVLGKLELLGVNTDSVQEFHIRNLIEDTKTDIITYCNLESYPTDAKLDSILVNMVAFNYIKLQKAGGVKSNTDTTPAGEVKSINVGGVSISYGGDTNVASKDYVEEQLKKQYSMLNRFRRVKW